MHKVCVCVCQERKKERHLLFFSPLQKDIYISSEIRVVHSFNSWEKWEREKEKVPKRIVKNFLIKKATERAALSHFGLSRSLMSVCVYKFFFFVLFYLLLFFFLFRLFRQTMLDIVLFYKYIFFHGLSFPFRQFYGNGAKNQKEATAESTFPFLIENLSAKVKWIFSGL